MCTRAFNNFNEDNKFLTTARNMDWADPFPTTLFAFMVDPGQKVEKCGTTKPDTKALTWSPEYSSVVAMIGTPGEYGAVDGMNVKGLVGNLLYDCNANYERKDASSCQKLEVLRWLQYVLDTCSSVQEVVDKFNMKSKIQLIGGDVPGSDKPASAHLSVSDRFGDSAIIEVHHDFIPYHNPEFRIMTNDPGYARQIELNQFWRWQWNEKKNRFASNTLPGTPFSADRFARASYYLNHLKPSTDIRDSLAQVNSVLMNASVPVNFDAQLPDQPNIAQTLWTTLAAHQELQYYFCNAHTIGDIWVDLKNMEAFPSATSQLVVVREESDEKGNPFFVNESLYGLMNEQFVETLDPFVISD